MKQLRLAVIGICLLAVCVSAFALNKLKTRTVYMKGVNQQSITIDMSYEPPIGIDSFYVVSTTNSIATNYFSWAVTRVVVATNGAVSTNVIFQLADSFVGTYAIAPANRLGFDNGDVFTFSNSMKDCVVIFNFEK